MSILKDYNMGILTERQYWIIWVEMGIKSVKVNEYKAGDERKL